MGKKILNYTIITSLSLIGLNIIGYFFTGSLNWGFHFLGFLPSYIFILYLGLASVIFSLFYTGKLEHLMEQGSSFMERKPTVFLSIVSAIFITCALIFRVQASVLGDSFTLIYNFRDYANGVSYLAPWHEPLSIYVLYYLISLIGSLDYPQIFTSFFIVEIFWGVFFIITTFYIVKNLFTHSLQRFMVFIFLLVLPYMEFFFGYIEVYSVSTLLLAVFVLSSALVLQNKLPFYVVPIIWVLLTFSHYINGLLGFAVLYLTYLEYKQKKIRSMVIGLSSAALLVMSTFVAVQFDIERLINISPVSHFLSLTNNISDVNAYSQAYTIISLFHLVDILNYLFMMAPFAALIILFWISNYKKEIITAKSINLWLALAIVPIFLYYIISKLEQGNASDWDVFGAHFFLLALFAALIFFQKENEYSTKIFSLIVCISLQLSLPWFAVNTPAEPSIRRFQSLWDRRILSHLGNYTHALRLFRYYDSQQDSLKQIDVWEKYSLLYPEDPRGYSNEIQLLNSYTPNDYQRKAFTYERWITVDPANDTLRMAYTCICVSGGNIAFTHGKLDLAKLFYFKAIVVDSTASRAFNNLGSVYAQEGKLDTAIELYHRAIKLDSSYAEAYYNIGNAHIDKGKQRAGIEFIKRAAILGNPQAKEFLKKNK